MSLRSGSYWYATRHPWSCVLFVLPLLVIYEAGLYLLGPTPPEQLRNGADVWLRAGLQAIGLTRPFAAPLVLMSILLAWGLFYREPQHRDRIGVWIGMTVESVVLAGALLGVSRGLWPMLNGVGQALDARGLLQLGATTELPEPVWEQIVRYIGAGIYEETLFRLLLFAGLAAVFRLAEIPGWLAMFLAAVASGLLFAGAHNIGPGGEPFQSSIFLYRTLAGVFFAWVYTLRGFGIAVGAHAGYDVLVGVLLHNPQPI
ncbi:MAG: CPBP family intramembrane metalloprotease [Planctomycetes bacterium]|nr:CPBP family intramembrane metalloprotease [Planctomycetota bacterium]